MTETVTLDLLFELTKRIHDEQRAIETRLGLVEAQA